LARPVDQSLRIADSISSGRIPLLKLAEILEFPVTSWDKKIAADLTAEMEHHLAEKSRPSRKCGVSSR
jgi:hypothetical protein